MTNFKIISNKVQGGTTPAMREAVKGKLGFLETKEGSQVKITVEPLENAVRTSISFVDTFNHHYRLTAQAETFYSSLDHLKDMIKRAVRKHHEKTRKNKRVEAEVVMDEEVSIAKEKVIVASVMSPEQAIQEMEDLGHDWYVFKNEDTKELAMVYRRFEGDYGLVNIRSITQG